MAKKKIIGKTKLKPFIETGSKPTPLNLITHKKKSIAKTYRLKQEDLERLRTISKDINEKSSFHISDTDIIRALIFMGSKFKKAKIINTLKEI
jgi:hypothetical protein